MQMFYEDEQVSMFAPDSCAGKMSFMCFNT